MWWKAGSGAANTRTCAHTHARKQTQCIEMNFCDTLDIRVTGLWGWVCACVCVRGRERKEAVKKRRGTSLMNCWNLYSLLRRCRYCPSRSTPLRSLFSFILPYHPHSYTHEHAQQHMYNHTSLRRPTPLPPASKMHILYEKWIIPNTNQNAA